MGDKVWLDKLLDKIKRARMEQKRKDGYNSLFAVLSFPEMEEFKKLPDNDPVQDLIIQAPCTGQPREVVVDDTKTVPTSPDWKVRTEAWDFALQKPGLPNGKEAATIRSMRLLTSPTNMQKLRHRKDLPPQKKPRYREDSPPLAYPLDNDLKT